MQDRRVAFALAATTIALKARVGQITLGDQVNFAVRALDFVHDDDLARLAVMEFLTHCRRDPETAGAQLQAFILDWSDGEIRPQDPQLVLAGILSTGKPDNVVAFSSCRGSA
jgi:hypothetical protein